MSFCAPPRAKSLILDPPMLWRAVYGVDGIRNAVHASSDSGQFERQVDWLFPPAGPARCNSACFNDSTCAVIKPHAITDGLHVHEPVDRFLSCGFTSHSTQNRPFRRRSPQASLLAWNGKRLNLSQQKHAFTKRNVLQHEINTKKLKPGLVAFYTTSGLKTERVYSQRKR